MFSTEIVIVDTFIVRNQARLRCYDNYGNIETINWYKNGILYTPENDDGEFQYNRSYIYFKNVKQRVAGSFACELVFKNGQHLMSTNTAYVDVKSKFLIKKNRKITVKSGLSRSEHSGFKLN
jgi:hypothetical protein